MTTQTMKNQNDAKVSRLKEAKRITRLLLKKNKDIKESIHTEGHNFITNKEVRSFGLKSNI